VLTITGPYVFMFLSKRSEQETFTIRLTKWSSILEPRCSLLVIQGIHLVPSLLTNLKFISCIVPLLITSIVLKSIGLAMDDVLGHLLRPAPQYLRPSLASNLVGYNFPNFVTKNPSFDETKTFKNGWRALL